MNPDPNQSPDTTPSDPAPSTPPVESAPQPTVEPSPVTPVETPETPVTGSPSPFGQASATPESSAPTPAPAGSKKKLIIIVSAIVGVLLLVGAAIAIYFMFFTVSKADYKEAYDQVQTVRTEITEAGVSTSPSESSLALAKTNYEEFKVENAKLADLKAIRLDKELNEKYKAYDAKAKAYIAFTDAFLPSLEELLTVTKAISSLTTLKSSGIQDGITAMESVGEVKDSSIKAFIDEALAIYKEILPQVKIYESSTASNADKLKALSAISASTKELSAATKTLSEDMKARTADISPKDSFNELSTLVTKKYNQ